MPPKIESLRQNLPRNTLPNVVFWTTAVARLVDAMGMPPFRYLTPQPFGPKLRLTKHMSLHVRHIRVLALLLAVIFLGAQFHYCADLNAGPSGSHICPLCSAVGSAVTPVSPGIAIAPATSQLEIVLVLADVVVPVPHAVSPRAPPLS
jgi:hypothetical protein